MATTVQSHLDECDDCRRYVNDTPRGELAEVIRQAHGKTNADQNTRTTGLSGTVVETPTASISPPAGNDAAPLVRPIATSTPSPSGVEHAVKPEEVPRDLYAQSKYRIIRLLGRGGMGTVFEAEHVRMKRPVAIKLINPELVDHPQALLRFEEEIRAVASLDHVNIARAFDAENIGTLQAFVMEFVRGQTLYDFLKSRGRLTVVEACRCVRQALIGLQHAHQQGLVHRDLKPQNLMLTRDAGQIKILDFGLAKAVSENRQSGGLTHSRATMGTYAYMAPSRRSTRRTPIFAPDIYSLGCTLYLLLAGKLPFDYESDAKLLLAHQNESPQPLHLVQPDVPEALAKVVARMLAKNPQDRPQTPKEAADALLPWVRADSNAAALASGPAATKHRTASDGQLNTWRWAGIAAVLLAAFGFGGWAAGLFSVRTEHGTIIISNVPEDAQVSVDGQSVTVTRNGDSVVIEAVERGPHHLQFTQGDREVWANDVTVKVAGELIPVRFEPTALPTADKPKQQDQIATATPSESAKPQPKNSPPPERADSVPKSDLITVEINNDLKIAGDDVTELTTKSWGEVWFGSPKWSRYDVTFKVMLVRGRDLTLKFNSPNYKNFRCLGLGTPRGLNWCDLNTLVDEKWVDPDRPIHKGGLEINRWYDIKLQVRGGEAVVFIDGNQWFAKREDRLPEGRISLLLNGDALARVQDFLVTSADDSKILWKGVPNVAGTWAAPQSSNSQSAGTNVIANALQTLAKPKSTEPPTGSLKVPSSTLAESEEGFNSLFNGKDLTGWMDAVNSYEVADGAIRCKQSRGGNLLTNDSYDNLVLRFEYQLPPGGNTGVALRMLPGGDPAIDGIEVQILDDTYEDYANGRDYYRNGSLCGLAPANLGHSRPIGEWNEEEITLDGDRIKVRLNGDTILDADIAAARLSPLDGKLHPGAWRSSGRVGFSGYDLPAAFRNIRIKRLPSTAASMKPDRSQPLTSKKPQFIRLFNGKDLTNWQTPTAPSGNWTVADGILTGREPLGTLYTTRKDFENVHVRVRARVNDQGNSGVVVRAKGRQKFPGYEAQINSNGSDPLRTGSIWLDGAKIASSGASVPAPNEWFTEEIVVVDNEVEVLVNGRITAQYVDDNRRFRSGPIGLELQHPGTVVDFSTVEVKMLPRNKESRSSSTARSEIDPLKPGTVWIGNRNYRKGGWQGSSVSYELHITGRNGNRFTGHKFDKGPGKNRSEIEGEMHGRDIEWHESTKNEMYTVQGRLDVLGNHIQFTFRGTSSDSTATTEGDGQITLNPGDTTAEN